MLLLRFLKLHTNKATGPDNMSTFVLRTFAEELSPAWHKLFQFSIDTHTVPVMWKNLLSSRYPKRGALGRIMITDGDIHIKCF